SMCNPARPFWLTTSGLLRATRDRGVRQGSIDRRNRRGIRAQIEIGNDGLDNWIVAPVYVAGGTELKPIKVRRPSSRAESTVWAVESTLTLVELLCSVMLFKVTLKASTEGSGAFPGDEYCRLLAILRRGY